MMLSTKIPCPPSIPGRAPVSLMDVPSLARGATCDRQLSLLPLVVLPAGGASRSGTDGAKAIRMARK